MFLCVWLHTVLALLLHSAYTECIQIVDNGYEDVVVGLDPDTPEYYAERLLKNIKELVISGNNTFFKATHGRAYIGSATILIPPHWKNVPVDPLETWLTYEGSDLRVGSPTKASIERPDTVQPGGCGEPGLYMFFPGSYILNLQDMKRYDRVFVEQLVRFWYGVFPETWSPSSTASPKFFSLNKDNRTAVAATACTDPAVTVWPEFAQESCNFTSTGLPDNMCSILDHHEKDYFDSLPDSKLFCSTSETTHRKHLESAPTIHNRLCDGQGVWDVISQHQDFQNVSSVLSSSLLQDKEVKFTIQQPPLPHIFLVLDASDTMEHEGKNKKQQRAVQRFLNKVPEGVYVALWICSGFAYKLAGPTMIDDKSRLDLIQKVPNRTRSTTCRGYGLEEVLEEVLEKLNGLGVGTVVILTTDDTSEKPGLEVNVTKVRDSRVKVVTIDYNEQGASNFKNLARISDGLSYSMKSSDIEDKFSRIWGEVLDLLALRKDKRILLYRLDHLDHRGNSNKIRGNFSVDVTASCNLSFYVEHNATIEELILRAPNGSSYTIESISVVDEDLSVLLQKDPTPYVGTWHFEISVREPESIYLRIYVTSETCHPQEESPITLKCWTNAGSNEVNAAVNPVAILAELKQGTLPVENAVVEAEILYLGESRQEWKKLILRDSGAGADTLPKDGIYSGYVAFISKPGHHLVRCKATGNAETIIFTPSQASFSDNFHRRNKEMPHASLEVDLNDISARSYESGMQRTFTGNLTRYSKETSFQVSREPIKYPPSRVTDLAVEDIELRLEDFIVTLSWTAPGDMLDYGKARNYTLAYSTDRQALKRDFDSSPKVKSEQVLGGSLHPHPAGHRETVSVSMYVPFQHKTIYFALKTDGNHELTSNMSNIVHVQLELYATETSSNAAETSSNPTTTTRMAETSTNPTTTTHTAETSSNPTTTTRTAETSSNPTTTTRTAETSSNPTTSRMTTSSVTTIKDQKSSTAGYAYVSPIVLLTIGLVHTINQLQLRL